MIAPEDSLICEGCVCESCPLTEVCAASELGQVAQAPQELALGVGPLHLDVESAPDIGPVLEPQSSLAPSIPLNVGCFLTDSPGLFDSDGGIPL